MRRILVLLTVFLLPASASAEAELSILAGYRTGGPSVPILVPCFAAPCPQSVEVEPNDDEAVGLILDIPVGRQLMFEILLNRQEGEFDDEGLVFPAVFPFDRQLRFDLTYLHFGVLRRWEVGRVSPFVAVGLGLALFESERPRSVFGAGEARLSASLGSGIQIDLTPWLAVRVEGRGYWVDKPGVLDDDFHQLELSSGLTFKL